MIYRLYFTISYEILLINLKVLFVKKKYIKIERHTDTYILYTFFRSSYLCNGSSLRDPSVSEDDRKVYLR